MTKEKEKKLNINVDEMMRAGVHLGHRTSRLHPAMGDFVMGIRNTIHVIDLKKTENCLEQALDFIASLQKQGGKLLFVGTKPPLRNLVKETALSCNFPYVVERWLGGTFTNFEVISRRIQHFKALKKEKEEDNFEKYTKKERIKKEKVLVELHKKFEGIQDLQNLPDAVFVCDIVKDKLCVKEAKAKGIKTVAIVDTNANPTLVDYPIPANDDAISSVRYILEKIKEVILNAKPEV